MPQMEVIQSGKGNIENGNFWQSFEKRLGSKDFTPAKFNRAGLAEASSSGARRQASLPPHAYFNIGKKPLSLKFAPKKVAFSGKQSRI